MFNLKKILSFIIIALTIIFILLVPYVIESGIIPVKNKMLAYSLIFVVMIAISLLVGFILNRREIKKRETEKLMALYNSLVMDNDSDKIHYDLARFSIERKNVVINTDKDLLEIRIKSIACDIVCKLEPLNVSINLDIKGDDEEIRAKLNELRISDLFDTEGLLKEKKEELYKRLNTIYREIQKIEK